jgi:hypothetical protein
VAYRLLADAVVVVHLAFIVFVAVGGLLVVRRPRWAWLHLPAVAWGAAIVGIGFPCPLTPLEKSLRRRGGEEGYEGGFVDRYVEDVVYPDELTPLLRTLAAAAIVASYGWLALSRRRARTHGPGRVASGAPDTR